jgi:hypothetical protein
MGWRTKESTQRRRHSMALRQEVTKRCRLSWLTNSALVYESKMQGDGWGCGVSANEYSSTLQGKSHLCIPFLGIARPQSQFPHSCVCERFIYCQDWSTYFPTAEQADRSWKFINFSQIYECRNWETEHYISKFCFGNYSFISGNTLIGTRHLYWILNGPSFAVYTGAQMNFRDLTSYLTYDLRP